MNLDLGLRVKLFRMSAGLRQREIADEIGVTVNFISMIERGTREPTISFLRKFAKIVGIPVSVLLWEPEEQHGTKSEVGELQAKLAALMAQYARVVGVKRK